VKGWVSLVVVALLAVVGCAGQGETIPVAIPGKFSGAAATSVSGPRIAVLPFQDKRADQRYLGQRAHLWGGQSHFDLPKGTVSDAGAQAFVEYLNRQGWRAALVKAPGADAADVTIQGTITDLSIDAKSGVFHTDLSAKSHFTFQIMNQSDDSTVRERVSGSATDQVFWFDPDDAEVLLTDLLESNFRKFVNDVRIDGRAVRLR